MLFSEGEQDGVYMKFNANKDQTGQIEGKRGWRRRMWPNPAWQICFRGQRSGPREQRGRSSRSGSSTTTAPRKQIATSTNTTTTGAREREIWIKRISRRAGCLRTSRIIEWHFHFSPLGKKSKVSDRNWSWSLSNKHELGIDGENAWNTCFISGLYCTQDISWCWHTQVLPLLLLLLLLSTLLLRLIEI